MLSNLSLQTLKRKEEYLRIVLKTEGKYLNPTGMRLLNKQISDVKKMIQEANNRIVIGVDNELRQIYVAPSAVEGFTGDCIYVTEFPMVWDINEVVLNVGQEVTLNTEEGEVIKFICDREIDA